MHHTSTLLSLLAILTLACADSTPEPRAGPMSSRDYLTEANAVVTTLTAADAIGLLGDSSVAFVDIREGSEMEASGQIPGAVHAPRGLLEFYIDPASQMHKDVFGSGKKIVFYCAGGGRSALAAKLAMDMGLTDVAHIGGGFRAWRESGGPVDLPNATPSG